MKIIRFTAENLKKLRAVEIIPGDSGLVMITGPNGSGKSSVLDAIFFALGGTKHHDARPIREGESYARVQLDLGEIVVTRKFTATGSSLTIEAESGARFPSPQKMLDDLLGSLTFDPLAFSRMHPRDQLQQLRALVQLEVDIDELDGLNRRDFDDRTAVNREIKGLQVRAEALRAQVPDELPEEEINVNALLEQMENASRVNDRIRKQQLDREEAYRAVEDMRLRAKKALEEANALRAEAATLDKLSNNTLAAADARLAALQEEPPLDDPVDVSVVRIRIDEARVVNAALDRRDQYHELQAMLLEKEREGEVLTEAIAQREQLKRDAITAAPMPVPGLGFGDGEVLYNGLPFAQASSAEQLRVSVAIAMAANPKLRILRIKDGSLLDERNVRLIAEMARDQDYQVWVEKVDTTGRVGVVMEDGAVREVHEHVGFAAAAAAAAEAQGDGIQS